MDWNQFYNTVFGGGVGLNTPGKVQGPFVSGLSGGTIDAVNPLDVSRLGLGAGNGVGSTPNYIDKDGTANITVGGERAGADNGMPFAIDWWGDGTAVSGNPGLVEKEERATGEGGIYGGLVEGFQSTFARLAVIVLGFIFVAVGLSMFKNTSSVVVKGVAAAL